MIRSGDRPDAFVNPINNQGRQGAYHKGEIISTRDAVENRRNRQLIGGGGGIDLYGPVEYDMTQTYGGKILLHVDPTNTAVTTGTTDPISGLPVKSLAGWWLSNANGVPLAINGNTTQYHIPQFPYPGTPINNSLNYWFFLGPQPLCF